MKKINIITSISLLLLLMSVNILFSAVACSLNDPDRDIKKFFPKSTGYKTDYISIKDKGGERLAKEIEEKLGSKLDPKNEAIDIPYALYSVLKGKEIIGYVHGVNEKGVFGLLQIFLAIDTTGKILNFYYQKISSPESKKFTSESFTKQFKGLTLADFYHHDAMKGMPCLSDKVECIKDPSEKNHDDFNTTLRGVKKNLILLDKFILNSKYDEFYNKLKGGKDEKK